MIWLYNKWPQNSVDSIHKLYYLSFCASGTSAQFSSAPLPQGSSQAAIKSWARVSSEGSAEGEPLQSSHTWLLAGSRSSQATGLRVLLGWQPEASLSSLPHGLGLKTQQLASIRASKQCTKGHTRRKLHSVCNLISPVTPCTHAIFCLSEVSH